MSVLLGSCESEIKRRLRVLVESNKKLGLACSGGRDSMSLCEYFVRLRNEFPSLKLCVLHINYGLRGSESDADQEFIESWCHKQSVDFELKSVDGSKVDSGIQNWARNVRYGWFAEWCKDNDGIVSVAHHLHDSAETALFKLARGSDLDTIASMSTYSQNMRIWRPFIKLDHGQIADLLDRKKIPHREDSSNATIKYSRNRIRHNVMPELEKVSSGAHNKLASAAKEISEVYAYFMDMNADLIRSPNLSFDDIGNMPIGLGKMILTKFLKEKISGHKLKHESVDLLYDNLMKGVDVDLTLDSQMLAQSRQGVLSVRNRADSFGMRRRQHEKYFNLEPLTNVLPYDADFENDI